MSVYFSGKREALAKDEVAEEHKAESDQFDGVKIVRL